MFSDQNCAPFSTRSNKGQGRYEGVSLGVVGSCEDQ